MTKTLKLTFDTEDSVKVISVPSPKDGLTEDEAKTAMDTIVATKAFDGITGAVKAVLYTNDDEDIYVA